MFDGDRISVWDYGKVLEMNGGDDCSTAWIYLTSLDLKMLTMINFMLCIYSLKKRKISFKKNNPTSHHSEDMDEPAVSYSSKESLILQGSLAAHKIPKNSQVLWLAGPVLGIYPKKIIRRVW